MRSTLLKTETFKKNVSNMNHMVQKRDSVELDIVELLLKNDFHVRGIAKELVESHSTIYRRLNDLNEENVVDYREEGRNKVYFLKKNFVVRNYVLQTELHKLTKLLRQFPEFNVIFEDILKKTDEHLILLFGSYAKGTAKKNSDIDIYIQTKDRDVKREIEQISSKINVKIGPFNKKSPLIREMIKNHVIIRGFEKYYDELSD